MRYHLSILDLLEYDRFIIKGMTIYPMKYPPDNPEYPKKSIRIIGGLQVPSHIEIKEPFILSLAPSYCD